MIKIGIVGSSGRIGQLLISAIQANKDFELIGGLVRNNTNDYTNRNYLETDCPKVLSSKCDLLIDFSHDKMLQTIIEPAIKNKVAIISGTTNLSDQTNKLIKNASNIIPILWSANLSFGINLINIIIEKYANYIDNNFDIEIVESHHRYKEDAPSGTAIMLGKQIAAAKNLDFQSVANFNRQSLKSARKENEIGFSSIRAGDLNGSHSIKFISTTEKIEFNHDCYDRKIFVDGALKAAKWLIKQKAGLYSMRDMFTI